MLRRTLAIGLVLAAQAALAAGTLRIDERKSISIGLGLKTSLAMTAAPTRSNYDLLLEGAIVSLSGQYDPRLRFALNGGRAPNGNFTIVDAVAMFEPIPELRVWAGRMLIPTDRATLVGPFFGITWDPVFISQFPNVVLGRGDGVVAWGLLGGGRVKYYAGALRGQEGPVQRFDDLSYTGRVTLSLWDLEPSYYANGSYYGAKQVLTFGVGGRIGLHASGADRQQFSAITFDGFFERGFGAAGVFTVDASMYRYDDASAISGLPSGFAYSALGAWLLPWAVGPGRVQVAARHQLLGPAARKGRAEATLNYLVEGAFLRFGLTAYRETGSAVAVPTTGFKLGAQIIL